MQIPLTGVAVGNGLTDPEIQYAYYPEYAYNFTQTVVVGRVLPSLLCIFVVLGASFAAGPWEGKSLFQMLAITLAKPDSDETLNMTTPGQTCYHPSCLRKDDERRASVREDDPKVPDRRASGLYSGSDLLQLGPKCANFRIRPLSAHVYTRVLKLMDIGTFHSLLSSASFHAIKKRAAHAHQFACTCADRQ